MSVSIVGTPTATSTGSGTATTLALTLPSGVANNDVAVIAVTVRDNNSGAALPSGYTAITGSPFVNGTVFQTLVGYKVLTTADASANITATIGSSATKGAFAYIVYRGLNSSTPLESTSASNGQTTSGTSQSTPSVTPTTSGGSYPVGILGDRAAATWSSPTETSGTATIECQAAGSGTNPASIAIIDDIATLHTAADAISATASAGGSGEAVIVYVVPASGGGTTANLTGTTRASSTLSGTLSTSTSGTANLSGTAKGRSAFYGTLAAASNVVPTGTWPLVQLLVGFSSGPGTAPTAGLPSAVVDLGPRLLKAERLRRGRNDELATTSPGSGDLTLDNRDGALDPLNLSSPFYSAGVGGVLPYRQAVLRVMWPANQNLAHDTLSDTTNLSLWSAVNGATGLSAVSVSAGQPGAPTTGIQVALVASTGGSQAVQVASGSQIPVQPGKQYTVSVYVDNHAGCAVKVGAACYDPFGNSLTSQSGSTVASGSHGRSTVTFTAASNCYSISPFVEINATTGTGSPYFNIVDLQVEQAGSASSWTRGGTWFNRFVGFIERWEPRWEDSGATGLIDATLVDYLALANRKIMFCALTEQILSGSTAPNLYYPMWEPQGALSAGNVTLNASGVVAAQLPLVPVQSGSGGSYAFGASPPNSSSLFGDDGNTGLQLTATSDGGLNGYGLQVQNVALAGAWAVEMWLATTSTSANAIYLTVNDPADGTLVGLVGAGSAGHFKIVGSGGSSSTIASNLNDGNLHQIVLTAPSFGTIYVYVDAVHVGSVTGTGPTATPWIGVGFGYGLNDPAWNSKSWVSGPAAPVGMFTGIVKHLSVYKNLTSTQITNLITEHYDAAYGWATGFSPQTTDQRIAAVLSVLNYQGGQSLDTGETTEGPASNWTGQSALQIMQQSQTDEDGLLFVDRNGNVCLRTRTDRFSTTSSQFTLGENTGASEIPYQGDLKFSADPTYLYNVDSISTLQSGNGGFPGVSAFIGTGLSCSVVNVTSFNDYGPNTLTESVNYANSDPTIIYRAQFKSAMYGTPQTRVPTATVDLAAYPTAFSTLLGADIGQRITVNRRPFGAPADSLGCWVEAVEESIVAASDGQPPQWSMTFDLSPVAYWTVAICDDAFYGKSDQPQTVCAY